MEESKESFANFVNSPQNLITRYKSLSSQDTLVTNTSVNEPAGGFFDSFPLIKDNARSTVNVSRWSIGWTTNFLMCFFYLIALIIATTHFVAFHYLDGRSVEYGISQTYVTTASNLLAYLFATSITIALSAAFCQHLWFIMRQSAFKLSTIEVLFSIRSNPLQLFRISAIKKTWILILLAIVLYIVPFATNFAPGALTVKSATIVDIVPASVPSFNASYVGNGTLSDIMWTNLAPTNNHWEWTNYSTWHGTLTSSIEAENFLNIRRLATKVVIDGEPIPLTSPCGSNCSYTIQFEGPLLSCLSSTKNTAFTNLSHLSDQVFLTKNENLEMLEKRNKLAHDREVTENDWVNLSLVLKPPPNYFRGRWNNPSNSSSLVYDSLSQTDAIFYVATLNSSYFPEPPVIVTQSNFTCIPSRTLYTVRNSYINNIQSLSYSTGPPTQLSDITRPVFLNGTYPGMIADWRDDPDISEGELLPNWNDEVLTWIRDCQLLALIQQIAIIFDGNYIRQVFYYNSTGTLSNIFNILTGDSAAFAYAPESRLNSRFEKYEFNSTSTKDIDTVTVSANALNKIIGDFTISAMFTYKLWPEMVNVTKSRSENVYTFSQPLNIILPYSVTLLLALPFLFIGMLALRHNGVSAVDGGFIQILSTTTGSKALQRAAAGNCLGGHEISQELKDLEIRFGELVDVGNGAGGVRRAGFGTKSEIVPLVKGQKYGYS